MSCMNVELNGVDISILSVKLVKFMYVPLLRVFSESSQAAYGQVSICGALVSQYIQINLMECAQWIPLRSTVHPAEPKDAVWRWRSPCWAAGCQRGWRRGRWRCWQCRAVLFGAVLEGRNLGGVGYQTMNFWSMDVDGLFLFSRLFDGMIPTSPNFFFEG